MFPPLPVDLDPSLPVDLACRVGSTTTLNPKPWWLQVDEIPGEAAKWAGVFVGIGVGTFIVSVLQTGCFAHMGACCFTQSLARWASESVPLMTCHSRRLNTLCTWLGHVRATSELLSVSRAFRQTCGPSV